LIPAIGATPAGRISPFTAPLFLSFKMGLFDRWFYNLLKSFGKKNLNSLKKHLTFPKYMI